ncbi:hypothetical protein [Haloprofundus marisrubri]|uniref:hypothetical protein n=1 Tax=Haloprofundus marisrubri TaxID=1514971 RepID=UPI0012BABB26|nr:hypothetical protein [Haloprofundus marisrubri]
MSVVFAVGVVTYGFVDPTALGGLTLFSVPTLLGTVVGVAALTRYSARGGGAGGVWIAVFSVAFALSLHGQQLLGVSAGIGDVSTATVFARAVGYAGSLAAVVGSLLFAGGVAIRRYERSVSRGDVTPLSFLLDVRRGSAAREYDWVTGALAVVGTASLVVAGEMLPWSSAIYTLGIATLLFVALYAQIRRWKPTSRLGVLSLGVVLLAAHLSQFTHPALLNGVVVVLTLAVVGYAAAQGEHVAVCVAIGIALSSLLGIAWAAQSVGASFGDVLAVSVEHGFGPGVVVGIVGYALGWALRPDELSGGREHSNQQADASSRSGHKAVGDD